MPRITAPAVASPERTLAMTATLNRCILIDLTRVTNPERADALLVLRAHAARIGATIDMRDLFKPKLFVNYGIAEHRETGAALRHVPMIRAIGA
jgi:hypothetical protein